ncbi:hypothetical protein GDO81_009409 [Engystomops pustulosus]|uniref:Uncharacterized protein n=1 Tax=Engystomops pustulosus TaxID=76066 RepID=A0AAV7BQX2_ENGPU|nr:hypothetical protein GDO81_009409 [Engystomops pustulosus]
MSASVYGRQYLHCYVVQGIFPVQIPCQYTRLIYYFLSCKVPLNPMDLSDTCTVYLLFHTEAFHFQAFLNELRTLLFIGVYLYNPLLCHFSE